MAFNIGLSGLNAASKDLDVTGNNIANASTHGFKKSRAEFADVYSVSAFGSSRTQSGSGVTTQAVTQHFNQGNLDFTDNALDLSISGQGFFVLKPNQTSDELLYTRAGAFQANSDGFIVNAQGQFLQGFPVDSSSGTVTSSALASVGPIQLPQSSGAPNATTQAFLSVNLDSDQTQPATAWVNADPTATPPVTVDTNSYNHSTSINVYDSLGNTHTVSYYFIKGAPGNPQTWTVEATIDGASNGNTLAGGVGTAAITAGTLAFDTAGQLDLANTTWPAVGFTGLTGVADLGPITTRFDQNSAVGNPASTQYSQAFSLISLYQDGYAPGRLSGINIADDGLVTATYTNGTTNHIAKVSMANFANVQGLRQTGDTNWAESINSGEALAGEAGSGSFGLVKSGALEQSNVDLTKQLVHLIIAQRNFQANAKTIETSNQITQTVINLR